jgi:RNA polymerase sigma factor (sigma-70 family)
MGIKNRQSLPAVPAEAVFERRMELTMASVDLYHTCLLGYLRSLAGHHDAEDILQELWKFVVVHFPEDKIQSFSLLRRKAYQLFVDYYRRKKSQGALMEKIEHEPPAEKHEYVFGDEEEARLQKKFWQEFPVELTDAQRKVLWHYARYGMTFAEIETALGVKASTACDWVKLGREKLQSYLDNH